MTWLLAPVALATLAGLHQDVRPVAFYVQGMSCEDCVRQVQAALGKVPSITSLDLKLKPPLACFRFASDQVSLQDVVVAVRGAGRNFDAKLIVDEAPGLPDKTLDALDRAISAVAGVKNSGAPNEHGRRYITLDLKKRTLLADVMGAGRSAGVDLHTPDAPPTG